MLDEEEKERLFLLNGAWAAPNLVMTDKDSTRTPPTFKAHHIMMAAARHWRNLSYEKKTAWRKRAVKLNSMPVPGQFWSFPKEISKKPRINGNMMLEQLVFDSLWVDWEMVVKIMKNEIYCHPWIVDSKKTYYFGKE
eukprot:152866-Ditylum_brightwellii.AAC.1